MSKIPLKGSFVNQFPAILTDVLIAYLTACAVYSRLFKYIESVPHCVCGFFPPFRASVNANQNGRKERKLLFV